MVPALWIALHFSFVYRANAVGMWPFDTGNHTGNSRFEFPDHFQAIIIAFRVLQLTPLASIVFVACRSHQLRWPLALLSLAIQFDLTWANCSLGWVNAAASVGFMASLPWAIAASNRDWVPNMPAIGIVGTFAAVFVAGSVRAYNVVV